MHLICINYNNILNRFSPYLCLREIGDKCPKHDHITPIWPDLHWLPVKVRVI